MSKVTSFYSTAILALTPTEIEDRIEEVRIKREKDELHPEGYFHDGIWYPCKTQEKASCCYNITPNYNLEMYNHCKTKIHLELLAVKTLIKAVIFKIEKASNIDEDLEIARRYDKSISSIMDRSSNLSIVNRDQLWLVEGLHYMDTMELFKEISKQRMVELQSLGKKVQALNLISLSKF